MKDRLSLVIAKLQLSISAVVWLLSKWRCAGLALLIAVLFFELIYWLFNFRVLSTIIFSGNVSLVEKLQVLVSPVQSIGAATGGFLLTFMLLLALVQGILLAGLIYIIRQQRKLDDKLVSGSSFATLFAIIGLGCPACGTSLVTPVVALFISGSAVTVSQQITLVATPLALGIGLYGLYAIGLKLANVRAKETAKSSANAA